VKGERGREGKREREGNDRCRTVRREDKQKFTTYVKQWVGGEQGVSAKWDIRCKGGREE